MANELKIGKMSTKELAKWFNISYDTLRRTKANRYKELQEYALFKEVYGGVDIIKIYIPEYINKKNSNYVKVKENIDSHWDKSGLDSKKNVAIKIQEDESIGLTLKFNSTYSYTCKASNELYGSPRKPESGEIGTCYYVLCVIMPDGKARRFTQEEYDKKKKLKSKLFQDKNDSKIESIKEAIYLQFKNKEINEEECQQQIQDLEAPLYNKYFEELEKVLPEGEHLGYRIYKEVYAW